MDNKPLPSLSGLGNEINTQPLQIEMNQIIRNHATESVDYINLLDHLFRKFANPPSDTHFERIYTYMSETYPAWVVWYDKHSFAKLYQMEIRYTYANFDLLSTRPAPLICAAVDKATCCTTSVTHETHTNLPLICAPWTTNHCRHFRGWGMR